MDRLKKSCLWRQGEYLCLNGKLKHNRSLIHRYYLFGSDIKMCMQIKLIQTINDIHVGFENRHVKGEVMFEQIIIKRFANKMARKTTGLIISNLIFP